MNEKFKILKKEIILVLLFKSILIYAITLFKLNQLETFELQNSIFTFFILLLTPIITLLLILKKQIEFSLKNFFLLGIIISLFSSLIRVFILNNFFTKLIYNYLLKGEKGTVLNVMTFLERTQEFVKFTLIGIIFFFIIGLIMKLKKRNKI